MKNFYNGISPTNRGLDAISKDAPCQEMLKMPKLSSSEWPQTHPHVGAWITGVESSLMMQ